MEELLRRFMKFLRREDVSYSEKKLRIESQRNRLEHKLKSSHDLLEAGGIIDTIEMLEMGLDFLNISAKNGVSINGLIEHTIDLPA